MPARASSLKRARRRNDPVPPTRIPDGAAARERITAAARRTFFRLGFARCTMDDLAAELGMSKKTLYLHFRAKEELIDALITRKVGSAVSGLESVLEAPGYTFAERAHRAMHHMLGELAEVSPVFLRDLRRLTPSLYARLEELRRINIPRLWKRLLELGVGEGAVRPEVDADFAAQFFLLAVQSLLLPENLDHLHISPSQAVAKIFDLTFAGLLTPAGRKDYEKKRAVMEQPIARV